MNSKFPTDDGSGARPRSFAAGSSCGELRVEVVSTAVASQFHDPQLRDESIEFRPTAAAIRAAGPLLLPASQLEEVETSVARLYATPSANDGINLNLEAQRRLLRELAAYHAEFD